MHTHSDIGIPSETEKTPAHFFATVLGISGGIYGLYYAYKMKSGVIGFIGYYLIFHVIFMYSGYVVDAIVPIGKKTTTK